VELIYSTQCWIIVITESVCDQKDGYKNLLPFYRHDMRERLASVEKSCKLRQPFTSCRIQTGNSRSVYEIKRGRPSSSLQPQLALKKKRNTLLLKFRLRKFQQTIKIICRNWETGNDVNILRMDQNHLYFAKNAKFISV
jgi:hypothetical protein